MVEGLLLLICLINLVFFVVFFVGFKCDTSSIFSAFVKDLIMNKVFFLFK